MARGPVPKPDARRRNAPTIPTTNLPAKGRSGRPPKSPYAFNAAGAAWWKWAWSQPQAAAWDSGSLYFIARRAQLEDDLAALEFTDELDLDDLLAGAEPEAIGRVEWALSLLKKSASGASTLMREMRELDNRLGLNPKALAELRWSIVADEKPAAAPRAKDEGKLPANVRRIRAVDPTAAAG